MQRHSISGLWSRYFWWLLQDLPRLSAKIAWVIASLAVLAFWTAVKGGRWLRIYLLGCADHPDGKESRVRELVSLYTFLIAQLLAAIYAIQGKGIERMILIAAILVSTFIISIMYHIVSCPRHGNIVGLPLPGRVPYFDRGTIMVGKPIILFSTITLAAFSYAGFNNLLPGQLKEEFNFYAVKEGKRPVTGLENVYLPDINIGIKAYPQTGGKHVLSVRFPHSVRRYFTLNSVSVMQAIDGEYVYLETSAEIEPGEDYFDLVLLPRMEARGVYKVVLWLEPNHHKTQSLIGILDRPLSKTERDNRTADAKEVTIFAIKHLEKVIASIKYDGAMEYEVTSKEPQ